MSGQDPTNGWTWRLNSGLEPCLELYDQDGQMLAFIKPRPTYCDRGHYQVCIEAPGINLEEIDGHSFLYYMDLDAAMWETVEWLAWRMHRYTHHEPHGAPGIRAWAAENMPAGELTIESLDFQSTRAPLPPEGD